MEGWTLSCDSRLIYCLKMDHLRMRCLMMRLNGLQLPNSPKNLVANQECPSAFLILPEAPGKGKHCDLFFKVDNPYKTIT